MSDAQANKAQQALALCLAQIRTLDPQSQQAGTAGPNPIFQVACKMAGPDMPAPDMQLLLS